MTDNPDQPYYGYYDTVDMQTPVRFLGLSSIGETLLDYTSYSVGAYSNPTIFTPPPNCEQLCVSPPPSFVML